MKKVALQLMDYGMDYEYEHNGSQGEKIMSYEVDIKVYTNEGKLILVHNGENEEFGENEAEIDQLVNKVEQICIEETSSF